MVTLHAGNFQLRDGAQITSFSGGSGPAGRVTVDARRAILVHGGKLQTNNSFDGAAGDIELTAPRLVVRSGGEISTVGTGAEGGRIAATASDLIHLEGAKMTSNGVEAKEGASIITLEAPLIVLNRSEVTSLTGEGEPLPGSGWVTLRGDQTLISADSVVAASSSVTISGLESEIGSRLVAPEGVFLDAGDLLRESCAARRSGTASSFTAMGRGGLPPDPGAPLGASYSEPASSAASDEILGSPPEAAAVGCRFMPDS
jgi:hypothetical protein